MENTVNPSKGYGVLFQQYFSLAMFHASFDAIKDLRENLPPFWPQHGMAFASAFRFGVRGENKRFLPSYNFLGVEHTATHSGGIQIVNLKVQLEHSAQSELRKQKFTCPVPVSSVYIYDMQLSSLLSAPYGWLRKYVFQSGPSRPRGLKNESCSSIYWERLPSKQECSNGHQAPKPYAEAEGFHSSRKGFAETIEDAGTSFTPFTTSSSIASKPISRPRDQKPRQSPKLYSSGKVFVLLKANKGP